MLNFDISKHNGNQINVFLLDVGDHYNMIPIQIKWTPDKYQVRPLSDHIFETVFPHFIPHPEKFSHKINAGMHFR